MTQKFAIAKSATPVLNTYAFREIFRGTTLPLDKQGLLRPLETVLFPGTKVQILSERQDYIVQVKIPQDYPCSEELYIDSRCLIPASLDTPERALQMPPSKTVLSRLKNLVGLRYIWGGNMESVSHFLNFYPPELPLDQLDPLSSDTWGLRGVDCSGLLYLATEGATPRNTSELIHFGDPVDSLSSLQPLDALVWKGHIVFVLNQTQCIESRGGFGVIITDLKKRLAEIQKERAFALKWDDRMPPHFVVRRFFSERVT